MCGEYSTLITPRPQHSSRQGCLGDPAAVRAIRSQVSLWLCELPPGRASTPQSQCASKPPSAQWREQYPFSGPERTKPATSSKKVEAGRQATDRGCTLWFKSTGLRTRPTRGWGLAWSLFKHATSPSEKWT